MKEFKENFSTFFLQVFHRRKTNGDNAFGKFSTRFGFPILIFHIMWIYTSLTFMLFCLDKGVHFKVPDEKKFSPLRNLGTVRVNV